MDSALRMDSLAFSGPWTGCHLAAVRLGEPEPFLDRVLVELVDDPVGGRAVKP
jgi:hypothetical protein